MAGSDSKLFKPVRLGALELQHGVVLAPLTRMRAAQPGDVPTDLMAEYYAQRASPGGLLISEASQVAPSGKGYPATPGIYSDEQVAGWRKVTDAVHAKGGLIVLQLWHVGRVSHSSHQPDGGPPVAPSAVRSEGKVFTASGERVDAEVPRELGADEVPGVVEQYRRGALMAQRAGFDGVELHGANGYLVEQFLSASTNRRTDAYGGSAEKRARFLLEVLDALETVWPSGRVGLRLSPWGTFGSMGGTEEERDEQWGHALRALEARPGRLAYVHLIERRAQGAQATYSDEMDGSIPRLLELSGYTGPVIAAGGFTRKSALLSTAHGYADAVAFGRHFISNPDLPARLAADAPINDYDRATFYGGDHRGYTDYPALPKSSM